MSHDSKPVCPQCGAALLAEAPAGLCPRCLMAVNMATQTVLSEDTETSAAPKPPPLPPEQIAPHFPQLEILECLGRGGMGVVYKARQKSLNRLVALKLLAPERSNDPQFAARFEKEARALAALNHSNIVTIHDHGQAGGFYFLLMEFVDGVTLRQLLHGDRISAREALAIVPQICDALQYAHDQGIVHRDIKPENILMDRRGRVKVADFGLAKIVGNELLTRPSDTLSPSDGERDGVRGAPILTDAGKVMGTPQYMSPEQVQAPGEVDHRADIYALGVVFYQMLTGELPGKRIEPPSKKVHIDVRLDEVVLRALEQKPERRYQQASILKTQVETIAESPDPRSSPAARDESAQTEPPTAGRLLSLVIVGTRAGQRVIVWPNVLLCFALVFAFAALGGLLFHAVTRVGLMEAFAVATFGATIMTGSVIVAGRKTPLEKLTNLDDPEYQSLRTSAPTSVESRFSRTAIVGTGQIFQAAVIAVAAFAIYRANAAANIVAQIVGLGSVLCLLIGCVLGWIAVAQIRRSAGKLYGMWLAVFDGLFFPLLALDFVGMKLVLLPVELLLRPLATHNEIAKFFYHDAPLIIFIPALLAVLMLDWLIIRRVWRAVSGAQLKPGIWLHHVAGMFILAQALGGLATAAGFLPRPAMLFSMGLGLAGIGLLSHQGTRKAFDEFNERFTGYRLPAGLVTIVLSSGLVLLQGVYLGGGKGERPRGAEPQQLSFGPVMERTLRCPRNGEQADALCFADGSVSPVPGGFFDRTAKVNQEWFTAKGGRIFPGYTLFPDSAPEGSWFIAGADIKFVMAPTNAWNGISTGDFKQALEESPDAMTRLAIQGGTLHSLPKVLPATFLFQTSEGTTGLLRLVDIEGADTLSDDPVKVKIRYKLVQSEGESRGATHP